MPELPEVETIRRTLKKSITGKKIAFLEVVRAPGKLERTLQDVSEEEFRSAVVGALFTDVVRKGKFLIAPLSSGETVIFHFMLSGWLYYFPGEAKVSEKALRHARLRFTFDDGSNLVFSDPRNMGKVFLVEGEDVSRLGVLARMGVEPLNAEFTFDRFKDILAANMGKTIKSLLTDQEKIAGIGNIYSDEILRRAGIKPDRRVSALTDEEMERLYSAIPEVLEDAIDEIEEGREGEMFSWRRKGELCPVCGGEVAAVKRGSSHYYWCPRCQK